MFSDLTIEIYPDDNLAAVNSNTSKAATPTGRKGKKDAVKKPTATVKSHKLVVSWHSKYLLTMLTSGMREAKESTIRLTTNYPKSLEKLLLSFYAHALTINGPDELIELLYLADEYDAPHVMSALRQMISPLLFAVSNDASTQPSDANSQQTKLEATLENARLILWCSSKLNLKLEPKVFSWLSDFWWAFGPREGRNKNFEEYRRNCNLLRESLDFCEDEFAKQKA
jgi:hypothetical protein